MITEEIKELIQEFLTDGIISDKERDVLLKKAAKLGYDVDEVDLYITAQQQKFDQTIDAAAAKRRGKTCPYCGKSIPQLVDKCPFCEETITPEASEELQEILDALEDALVAFKSGENIDTSKANVERYIRKANLYFENNPKVQKLLAEITTEVKIAENKMKSTAIKSMLSSSSKAAGNKLLSILGAIGAAILSFIARILTTIFKNKWSWIILGVLGIIIFVVIDSRRPEKNASRCIEAAAEYIDNDQLLRAEALCAAYIKENGSWSNDNIAPAYILLVQKYLDRNDTGKAIGICREQEWCFSYSLDDIPYKYEDEIVPLLLKIMDKCIEEGNYIDAKRASTNYDVMRTYKESTKILYKLIDCMKENGATEEEMQKVLDRIYRYGYEEELVPVYKYAGLKPMDI